MTGARRGGPLWATTLLLVALAERAAVSAQALTYRGFADVGTILYPQTTPNDDTRAVADGQFRVESALTVRRGVSVAGSLEARAASHDQTTGAVTFWDRTLQRPALAVRTVAVTFTSGAITLELGKQFVRWGQSDIISPTDHFTPKDYLIPVGPEPFATTAARVSFVVGTGAVEGVYTPRITPSRMPLIDQRWAGADAAQSPLPLENGSLEPPAGSQYGVRWHQNTRRVEYSGTFFQGFNHLAVLEPAVAASGTSIDVSRRYPKIQAWGGDAAVPLPGVTMKLEADWLRNRDHDADDYGLWVLQGERQQAAWLFLGGYVGEWVTADRNVRSFAPDRGLARSVIGRAAYTSDTNRSFAVESVVRQNGDGLYAKVEYSHPLPSNWRLTLQMLVIRGVDTDFLGQYDRNSFAGARARYSF